jgi:hypothetical protein
MSKIQEFITAWNTAVDAEIATAQSQIDAYLAARQTAIALTDPFVLKIPVAQKEDPEYGRLLIPGFDATTLGQIFEWTYPIDGEIVTNQNGYRDDKRGLIFMFDDEKTDTRIYIDGYTYGTMSYLSDQYFLALKSRED